MVRPVYSQSAARDSPINRGSSVQAPMSAPASPTRTNRNASLLRAVASRMSEPQAIIAPAPVDTPSIAAMIGRGQVRIALIDVAVMRGNSSSLGHVIFTSGR